MLVAKPVLQSQLSRVLPSSQNLAITHLQSGTEKISVIFKHCGKADSVPKTMLSFDSNKHILNQLPIADYRKSSIKPPLSNKPPFSEEES